MESTPLKVLLVEDNPGDARLVHELLLDVSDTRYDIEPAVDLAAGLEQLTSSVFDVVLLDLSLPDSQGLSTLERVLEVQPDVPVIINTGLDNEELAVKALNQGAQDYLVKGSMDAALLSRAIRYTIERKKTGRIIKARLRMLERINDASLEDALRLTLDVIEEYTQSNIGFYHFVEADQETLSLQGWSTNTLREMCSAEGRGQHYNISEAGVWVDCMRERRPVIHNDYASLPHRKGMPEGHAPVTRELVMPILRDGRIVAIIGVGNKPTIYTESDIEVASLLGDFSWEIIERKRADEKVRDAELRYRTLFEHSPDGVLIIDPETTLPIEFNDVACEQLGYSREEFYHLRISDYEARESPEETDSHVRDVARKGWDTFETQLRRKDGEIRDVLVSVQLVSLSGRDVMYGIMRDITEKKEAERRVRESREATEQLAGELQAERDRFEIVMENSPNANLVMLDRDFNFVMVNSSYAESCRVPREELIGKNHFVLFPHEENEAIFRKVRDTGEAIEFREKPFEFPDQPWRGVTYWDWTLTPVMNGGGQVRALVFSLVDVTEKVLARQYNEALTRINVAINSTLDFDAISDEVMSAAREVLHAESALLVTKADGGYRFHHIRGAFSPGLTGEKLTAENEPVVTAALTEGATIAAPDFSSDDRFDGAQMKKLGVASELTTPLRSRDDIRGAISFLYHSGTVEFTQAQVNFVEKLAVSISLAMENTRLFFNEQESRAKIQSYATKLSLLHKVGLTLNRETDRSKLLNTVLQGAAEITSAGVAAMILVNKGRTELVGIYSAPWYDQKCAIQQDASQLHLRIGNLVGSRDKDSARINFDDLEKPLNLPEGHPELQGLLIGVLKDMRGRVKGYFMLSCKAGGVEFSVDDEEIISLLAAQSSVALVSAENFEREHEVAETLQSSLLPDIPVRQDLEVGLVYRSASAHSRLGGDFYDFIEMDDGKIAVAVGDVCGKGLEAATATAMIKYMLRAYIGGGLSAGDCLTMLNRAVAKQITMEKFVTLGLAILDPADFSFEYSSAGHPPPVLFRRDDADLVEIKQAVPLGVLSDYEYRTTRAIATPDNSLLMYTDGLIEARPPGGEPFGENKVIETVRVFDRKPLQGVVEELMEAAVDYSGGNLRDDMALVVVRFGDQARS